jgi:hypothetical protein
MDILNEAAFVTGYLDAAAELGPSPASLYPETAARIRAVVARLVELETADRARRERLRQIGARGGRVGGPKGGAAKVGAETRRQPRQPREGSRCSITAR